MKNANSMTLFRFVNIRSAQSPKLQALEFRYAKLPPVAERGVFFDAIRRKPPEKTKYEALVEASGLFKDVIKSKKDLRSEFRRLLEFSDWLAENKSSATVEEIANRASVDKLINELQLEKLWNNIFYQATVQENIDLKDSLIQLVKAFHMMLVVLKYKSDLPISEFKAIVEVSAQADLVLPAFLFDEEQGDQLVPRDGSAQQPLPFIPDRLIKQQLSVSKDLLKQRQLSALQQGLNVLATSYKVNHTESYNLAIEQYNEEIKPIYEDHTYRQDALRREFCSSEYIRQRTYDANDPCQQLPYLSLPKLPPFKFRHEKELVSNRLQQQLDPVAYQTLMECIDYQPSLTATGGLKLTAADTNNPQQLLDSIGSFAQLNDYVHTEVQKTNAALISNTGTSNRHVSVGGMLFPVSEEISSSAFEYRACGITTNLQRTATFFIGVPDASWQIASIKVSIANEVTSDSYFLDNPIMERKGNEIILHNIEGFPANFNNDQSESLMGISILFTNGCRKIVPQLDIAAPMCFVGTLEGECDDNKKATVPAYIPKGFGVKLLGIADYKRVEQTVHCYVEGEVSSIENIMARAYREKSSRLFRRTEDTRTQIAEEEREQLTDTITTDRFEMQTEVNKILQESKSLSAFVNSSYSGKIINLNAGIAHAHNTSSEDSTRNLMSQLKEITNQAQDRVINRVKRERVQKVIDEFEEHNKHGYDNRKGDKHVVGVYRWVDKIYKNQVYNYGKRMMFEFMIPEPGKLHTVAMKSGDEQATTYFQKPDDPRTNSYMRMHTAADVNETIAMYWAAKYHAEIPILPDQTISISAAFADSGNSGSYVQDKNFVGAKSFSIDLPEDYKTTAIEGNLHFVFVPDDVEKETHGILTVGNQHVFLYKVLFGIQTFEFPLVGIEQQVQVNLAGADVGGISVSMNIHCELKSVARKKWQQACFQAIMESYKEALDEYQAKVQNEQNKVVEIKQTNPGFYRQIENTVLRKNCISYLVRHVDMGQSFTQGQTIDHFHITQNKQLNQYSSLVKFIEQAFEWDLISYHFYPFYWAEKGHWSDLYSYDESDDPIFRNFMQSGMARVIVTVRPGFEEAVQLYMSTGKIWNGGEIPVIGNPLYLSIIDEIRQTETVKEGKAWVTRIPTSLTILQADSAGLLVEKALPCDCDNLEDFEDPNLVPCSDRFVINKNLIGGDTGPENDPTP